MVRLLLLFLLAGAGWVAWKAYGVYAARADDARGAREERPVAVETGPVEAGTIREVRTLSGTLEASTRFDVASKVGGRIEELRVELGDEVRQGDVVAVLEDEEFAHEVAQAEAALAVEEARRDQARITAELAQRDAERFEGLRERGVASESELDEIATHLATSRAALAVAEADVHRARTVLDLARHRLGEAQVRALWTGAEPIGLVSRRHQDAGSTVQPGSTIVSVVVLDPLVVAVAITERDYARLSGGQPATLATDAYPERSFEAEVARIAPVFAASSRQARLELRVKNPDAALKPGMFVRVRVVLREEQAETIVPRAALVRRQGEDAVFVIEPEGTTVRRVPVRVGIIEDGRAQVFGEQIAGSVVTLGQQLLSDGSAVLVVPFEDEPRGSVAVPAPIGSEPRELRVAPVGETPSPAAGASE